MEVGARRTERLLVIMSLPSSWLIPGGCRGDWHRISGRSCNTVSKRASSSFGGSLALLKAVFVIVVASACIAAPWLRRQAERSDAVTFNCSIICTDIIRAKSLKGKVSTNASTVSITTNATAAR